MSSLLEYYRKNTDENGNIVFSRVKEEDITICGKTIEQIITILKALDIERITNIEMTMENLNKYIELYIDEQRRLQAEVIQKMFSREKIDKE